MIKSRIRNPFLSNPRICLGICFLLISPLLWNHFLSDFNSDARILLEGDQRNLATFDRINQIMAEDVAILISMEPEDLFSQDGLDKVRQFSDQLLMLPEITTVKSLTHAVKPVRRGLSFEMVPLVPEGILSEEEREALSRFSLTHPLIRNVMVSEDGTRTLITATYRNNFSEPEQQKRLLNDLEETLAQFRSEDCRFQTLSIPQVEYEVRSQVHQDGLRFLPAAAILILGILWMTLKSLRLLIFALLNPMAVLALLSSLMAALSITWNLYSIMLLPLIGGIHLTLLIHLSIAFKQSNPQLSKQERIQSACNMVFRSSIYACITTILGCVSLMFSEVQPVLEFGACGALGIPGLSVLCLMCGFRDSVASRERAGNPETKLNRSSEAMALWFDKTRPRRKHAMLATGILTVVSIPFIQNIRTDVRAKEFLQKNSATRSALEELDEHYGGYNLFRIELKTSELGGINDIEFLKSLERLHAVAEMNPGISGVYSYSQLLSMMNHIWNGEKPDEMNLPENRVIRNIFIMALKAANFPFMNVLCDPGYQTAYLIVRTRDMSSREYLKVIREIEAVALQEIPAQTSISTTEGIHSILQADRRIVSALWKSSGITVLAVGMILTVLWRSIRLAMTAVWVNLIPFIPAVLTAVLLDIPLNSVNIMVFALAFAIAVDDSVHFITFWFQEFKKSGDSNAALRTTFQVKSPAIIATSALLAVLFATFSLFSFPPIREFGILAATVFGAALASMIFLLPALLSDQEGINEGRGAHPRAQGRNNIDQLE